CFRTDPGTHDGDDLGAEPVLLEEFTFFDDEDDDVTHAHGRHADANLLEWLALRVARTGDCEKQNYWCNRQGEFKTPHGLSRIKQLEHLEPLERLEPSS